MTDEPENPPAFPVVGPLGVSDYGMTLRDWFAGQAMGAMLNGVVGEIGGRIGAYSRGDCNAVIVDRAYTIAAAMLAERAK